MPEYSVSPAGEKFPIPVKGDYAKEFKRIEKLAAAARAESKEVVVVIPPDPLAGSLDRLEVVRQHTLLGRLLEVLLTQPLQVRLRPAGLPIPAPSVAQEEVVQ
jgi:hypothetical protein